MTTNFNFTAGSYAPPASTAVNFAFGAAVSHYNYTGTGGLTLAGAATHYRGKVPVVAGGVALAGAAATRYAAGSTHYNYTGVGGLTLSGAALLSKHKAPGSSGGLTFAGAAITYKHRGYTGSGGLVLGGAANWVHGHVYSGAGGVTLGGAAPAYLHVAAHAYAGSGGLTLAGSALTTFYSRSQVVAPPLDGASTYIPPRRVHLRLRDDLRLRGFARISAEFKPVRLTAAVRGATLLKASVGGSAVAEQLVLCASVASSHRTAHASTVLAKLDDPDFRDFMDMLLMEASCE